MMPEKRDFKLHDQTVFWGTLIGFVAGTFFWLFRVPRRGEETRREIVEAGKELIVHDPVEESLETGKALARKRQQALQQSPDS